MHANPTTEDIEQLNDLDLIAERASLREKLGNLPVGSVERAELSVLYARLTTEFDRRARAAWTSHK